MARFLRFLCAVATLPFACALAFVFVDAFRLMPMSGDALFPPGALCLAGAPEGVDRNKLYNELILAAVCFSVCCAAAAYFGLF